MFIFKANNKIVDDLRASGALWSDAEFEHSYPHCWRCHNPVIFRATAQWFIAMDQNLLRRRSVDAIDGVAYTPDWGRTRQQQMIETHPEWCISRQRTWGTPIPAVICTACNESILDPRVARAAAKRFGEVGASAWWSDPVETYLPAGFACPHCGGTTFEKEKNIVDIWFESGVSHLAVLGRDGMTWPSDVVLEGGDQYRGWFRSSLLTAVAIKGERAVSPRRQERLGERRARPRDVEIDRHRHRRRRGDGEMGRRRSALVDGVGRVLRRRPLRAERGRASRARLSQSAQSHSFHDLESRRSRRERRGRSRGDGAARPAGLQRRRRVCGKRPECYARFDIHDAYLQAVEFESAMSGLYFDAMKDPLYSLGAASARRRSAQSALLYVLHALPGRARADSVVHDGRSVAIAAGSAARRYRERLRSLARRAGGEGRRSLGGPSALGTPTATARAGRGEREPARFRSSRVACSRRPTSTIDSRRSAITCARHSSCRSSISRSPPAKAAVVEICRRTARSASAAGSFANSGPIRRIPTICADCAAVVNALG